MSDKDDFLLVNKSLNGDSTAFATLVDRYQKPVFNAALRITGDYEEAQDVTQSVFLKAFEKLESFSPEYKFFSWIYRMTVNHSLNVLHQKKPYEALHTQMVSPEKTPAEKYAETELSEMVQESLMELQIDNRVILVLKHFGDFSYKEISYILDIPENKVKSRLFTARQLLKGMLHKKGTLQND